jgi:hypothetical protein
MEERERGRCSGGGKNVEKLKREEVGGWNRIWHMSISTFSGSKSARHSSKKGEGAGDIFLFIVCVRVCVFLKHVVVC